MRGEQVHLRERGGAFRERVLVLGRVEVHELDAALHLLALGRDLQERLVELLAVLARR